MTQIGHNNPPLTPFEVISGKIHDLYEEAKNWLDGEPVNSQGVADNIAKLITMIRAAEKEADELRKSEVKPLDEAKAEIQSKYAPLIADTKSVRGKTVLALEACKKALSPWLAKIEAENRAKAEAARKEAEAKAAEAQEAMRKAQVNDLADREEAEALIEQARRAEADAKRAEKERAHSRGGGRAIGLRTSYEPVLVNATEAARHYWTARRAEMQEFLVNLARQDVRAGKREIPGFNVEERKDVA